MCVGIVCETGRDVINFEINLIFLIKSLSYTTKNSSKKPKYLENEMSFKSEIKSIFHHSQRAASYQKLSKKSAPLRK